MCTSCSPYDATARHHSKKGDDMEKSEEIGTAHNWKAKSTPWPGVRLQQCSCGAIRMLCGNQIISQTQ